MKTVFETVHIKRYHYRLRGTDMEFDQYSTEVQKWVRTVLENRGSDAQKVLENCRNLIAYGTEREDCGLIGTGYFYAAETYYGLNDGSHFFETMTQALTYLNHAAEWELVVRCYNFLGIFSMSRGNPSIALDYYMNGIHDCDAYDLPMRKAVFLINMGLLYLECGHYRDAQDALKCAYEIVLQHPEDENYAAYLSAYYSNMAECLILQENLEEAKPYMERMHKDYWVQGDLIDHLVISCVDVIYYHKTNEIQKRDESIQWIYENLPDNLTVLDIFNDFYRCCLVLLETDQNDLFWRMIDVIEPQVVNFKIINLHLKVLSLKMKYYRKHSQNAEYLQAAGLYYELSERNENETRQMLSSVISLRKSLEKMRRARMKAERKNMVLRDRSEHDPLTHMANRFRMNDYLEEVFGYSQENEIPIAMEILDIDYFKEFNDNYGHQEGDRCLVEVAKAIGAHVDENHAFCARYGGDEFVIIYVNVTRDQAVTYAQALRSRVMELEIAHRFSKALPIVTISQGICWGIPEKENRRWDFLHTADNMLYRVKKFSRNNFCVGGIEETEDVTMGTPL